MAGPYADEEAEKPLDPAVEKVRRKLVRFALINLAILFAALIAVVGALVYKSRNAAPTTPPAAGDFATPPGSVLAGDIALPAGTKVIGQAISGNRISIDAELADGTRTIFVYDIGEGRMVGRFTVKTQ